MFVGLCEHYFLNPLSILIYLLLFPYFYCLIMEVPCPSAPSPIASLTLLNLCLNMHWLFILWRFVHVNSINPANTFKSEKEHSLLSYYAVKSAKHIETVATETNYCLIFTIFGNNSRSEFRTLKAWRNWETLPKSFHCNDFVTW